MDIQEKIQLGESKYIDAVNSDTTMKIQLNSNSTLSIEYDIQNILDVTQVFDDERQNTDIYRLHGALEYLAVLNDMPKAYKTLTDFFSQQPPRSNLKNILSDFNFYIVKPSTGFTELVADQKYVKNYDVIGVVENIEVIKTAYSKNIFGEQQYNFIFNIDIDLTNVRDGLNFPITEIGIYAEYIPQANGNGVMEIMERKTYDANGNTIITSFSPTPLNIGDTLLGHVINYDKRNYLQTEENVQEYYIYTEYNDGGSKYIKWKYNPIIPIAVRVFEDDLQLVNTGTTSVEDVAKIPDYATPIDSDGNFVWRNLLDKGFFDPISNVGTNFPFVNQRHYIFDKIIIKIQPDLTHANTEVVFNQIAFGPNTKIKSVPNSSIDDIGNLC